MSRCGHSELLRRFCSLSTRTEAPSCALVVAHPDDEIIGAGGRLLYLQTCHILYLTDGAPRNLRDSIAAGYASREAYSRARFQEADEALGMAGVRSSQVQRLGIVDQESAWSLEEIIIAIVRFLKQTRPELLLTHAYEGGHPDHDSASFAVHMACELLGRVREETAPLIVEMAGYHAWEGTMRTGKFLPAEREAEGVFTTRLSKAEVELKKEMMACHHTQQKMLENFGAYEESFRIAPRYDFRDAPHEGTLFYEKFDWGMSGCRWRKLAAIARESVFQSGEVSKWD